MAQYSVTPVKLPIHAARPDGRPFVIQELLAAAKKDIAQATDADQRKAAERVFEALHAELELESKVTAGLSKTSDEWKQAAKQVQGLQRESEKTAADWQLALAQQKHDAAVARIKTAETGNDAAALKKAKTAKTAAEKAIKTAEQRVLKANANLDADVTTQFSPRPQKVYPETSSGRRLAFASWLVAPENPLTARVAINHIWLRHFGRALVPTVNDFGAAGRPPTHPALLDWLAAELIDSDWSMKRMHRLMVTSAAYRMESAGDAANRTTDPDNDFYWHGPQRRMEGELVRDNLLHLAGRLDASLGGPDVDHKLAQESRRRSIYLRHAHEKLVEFVQIFDGPAVSECYSRETSIQPHQALALANSKLTVDAAAAISAQLTESTSGDDVRYIQQLVLKILGRPATAHETEACLAFLSKSERPRYNLAVVLLNHNDFLTIR